jgi:hypothetical protein
MGEWPQACKDQQHEPFDANALEKFFHRGKVYKETNCEGFHDQHDL